MNTTAWTLGHGVLSVALLALVLEASCYSRDQDHESCVPLRYNTTASRVERKINVHLIPHTHDDTGWLKTVDQYYYGSRQDIQIAGVQYVLDTVIYALLADPNRKFAYAEMSFFTRWWTEQTEETQDKVKRLVDEGRLSFINGGWVQHDEAAAHYVAMIDQTSLGHRFLNATFGYRPRVGWQIDPFGHSNTHASLMSAYLGFDGLFFGRSDYQDLERRRHTIELEMLWRGAESFGKEADIFLGTFPTGNYGPPAGFYFDWGNYDPPVQDNVCLTEINVEERVDSFVKAAEDMAAMYQDDDVFWPMGTDFTYSNAFTWYKNMDKLIHYVNLDGRVNAFYSTPEDYVDAKNSFNQTWPVKTDDFFPYADCPHCYWTGYFVSRAASKGYIRQATSYLQIARQLELITQNAGHSEILEEAVALLQHHDSITGTEKQHVTNDYHKRLNKGWIHAERFISKALSHLLYTPQPAKSLSEALTSGLLPLLDPLPLATNPKENEQENEQEDLLLLLHQCRFLNVSVCEASRKYSQKDEAFLVVVYNPLSTPRKAPVEMPMDWKAGTAWAVKDSQGRPVPATWLTPGLEIGELQKTLFHNKALPSLKGASISAIGFVAHVPAMGYETYFVGPTSMDDPDRVLTREDATWTAQPGLQSEGDATEGQKTIQGQNMSLKVSEVTGLLSSAQTRSFFISSIKAYKVMTGEAVFFDISGCWYNSSAESGPEGGVPSGAYIFRPVGTCHTAKRRILDGFENPVLYQIEYKVLESLTILARFWLELDHLEVIWTAGPIDIADGWGKELAVTYTSNLSTGSTFYTDSNGREFQKRTLNHRATWDLNVTEPVSGNYYPITAGAYVKNKNVGELSVLVDRAQGATSLKSGELEVMVHRRTLFDDSRGVAEPLNETIASCRNCDSPGLIVRGSHLVSLKAAPDAAIQRRRLQQEQNDPVLVAFGPVPKSYRDAKINGHFTALRNTSLPENVQIITAQALENEQVLLRFAHLFQVGEDADDLTSPVKLDLNKIFSGITFREVQETGLAAAQPLKSINRLKWSEGAPIYGRKLENDVDYARETGLECSSACSNKKLTFTLRPMEIRTFVVSIDAEHAAKAKANERLVAQA